jgi:hypothetical protein
LAWRTSFFVVSQALLHHTQQFYDLDHSFAIEAPMGTANVELKPISMVAGFGNVLCINEALLSAPFPIDTQSCPIASIAETARQTGKNRQWRKTV